MTSHPALHWEDRIEPLIVEIEIKTCCHEDICASAEQEGRQHSEKNGLMSCVVVGKGLKVGRV